MCGCINLCIYIYVFLSPSCCSSAFIVRIVPIIFIEFPRILSLNKRLVCSSEGLRLCFCRSCTSRHETSYREIFKYLGIYIENYENNFKRISITNKSEPPSIHV